MGQQQTKTDAFRHAANVLSPDQLQIIKKQYRHLVRPALRGVGPMPEKRFALTRRRGVARSSALHACVRTGVARRG